MTDSSATEASVSAIVALAALVVAASAVDEIKQKIDANESVPIGKTVGFLAGVVVATALLVRVTATSPKPVLLVCILASLLVVAVVEVVVLYKPKYRNGKSVSKMARWGMLSIPPVLYVLIWAAFYVCKGPA